MQYIKLTIEANEPQQEALLALLNDFGPTGYEQTDVHLVAYFEEEGFRRDDIRAIVQGYVHQVEPLAARNWNAEWERSFEPVVVGRFCAIRAHFHEPIAGVAHEVVVTPKMSFGTGHHATTYMMVEWMETLEFGGKSVFDFGTGTGLLAILAEKLGAASVYAIDVDEWSMANARENLVRNGCARVELALSSQVPARQFDLILANINKNVLLQYGADLKNACKKGTQMVLSGLLVEDHSEVLAAFQRLGFIFKDSKQRDKWLSLVWVNE